MQNFSPATPSKRGAVQPIYCLKTGWILVRDQYWLFVGMSAVAIILGSLVPFGIMFGPMMCGIYLSVFQRRRGQTVEFGALFKGFDFFGESVVATLVHYLPIVIIIIPFYIALYGGLFLIMPRQGRDPDPSTLIGFFAVLVVFGLIMMVLIILLSVIFTFSYPLIVDRKMSGIDAVKLSARGALANFWPLLGLLLLNGLIGFAGVLLCYVGIFLALPVTLAAIAVAYEQVFGLGEVPGPILPPPPPSFT
ncbi:MAG: hypothetical protein H0T77_13270 [Pyrinomonadaceae bacterium]|jgi:hypothetical protein|nr:hypothetical protein [Pyrinomonadaceae bacterium]